MFEVSSSKKGKSNLIPVNFVGNGEGEEYIFDRNDEIFNLSQPTTKQRIPTDSCSFCKK